MLQFDQLNLSSTTILSMGICTSLVIYGVFKYFLQLFKLMLCLCLVMRVCRYYYGTSYTDGYRAIVVIRPTLVTGSMDTD